MDQDSSKIRGEIYQMNLGKIRKHYKSCQRHWNTTWLPSKEILQNKKCLDVGIWKGILNAKARKEFKCITTHGVEPDQEHRLDCKKFNPHINLYESINDLPSDLHVDIIFLHAVICLMGELWESELETLLKKVKSNILHVRHKDYNDNDIVIGVGRETNNYNIKNYKQSPSQKKLLGFLQEKNYKLLSQNDGVSILEYENYTDR